MIDKVKIELKTTMTSTYFLPFIDDEINLKHLDLLKNSYLYNNGTDKQFSVLYKFSGSVEFLKFEEGLFNNKLYLGHEDYNEYVLYKFRVPLELQPKLDMVVNQNTNRKLGALNEFDKRVVVRFARRRLLTNVELLEQRLNGEISVERFELKDENFKNWISKPVLVTATDMYIKAKEAKMKM